MSKNYGLDKYQEQVLNSETNNMIIAGAGSGKTFTLISKISYLIEEKKISPKEILVISFTNASVNDLKDRVKYPTDIFTFHKLGMNILDKARIHYTICNPNIMNYIINEELLTCDCQTQKLILKYLKFKDSYKKFIKSSVFLSFQKLILTFLNLWKTNDYSFENLDLKKLSNIEKKILTFFFKIYKTYIIEKNSRNLMDFDDLILMARYYVKNTALNYKYIIIDEFQDTSLIRLNLIKEMYFHFHPIIIVVGDDYQSIFRFTGCDLNIFLNFSSIFPKVQEITLRNVYRCSQEIVDIATKFISKNPLQIPKELISSKKNRTPLIFSPTLNYTFTLKKILTSLNEKSNDIMILSRNNNDIYKYIDSDFEIDNNIIRYNGKNYKYCTVHKSKGLEAEYVIILNCNNNILGFPNKIENAPLTQKVFPYHEIKYAEERRLFYVAITRAKNTTYLIYDELNYSIFIKEIKKITKARLGKITYFK